MPHKPQPFTWNEATAWRNLPNMTAFRFLGCRAIDRKISRKRYMDYTGAAHSFFLPQGVSVIPISGDQLK